MRAVDIIQRKRDGHELPHKQIEAFIRAVTHGTWPDYQVSALLMAIFLRGMSQSEAAHLTRAMARSGTVVDLGNLDGPKIDKHSTGGVGDKTSLILAPLAAACGVYVPMMSGRGLGHSGGTLDKLESIPGFRVHLSLDEYRSVLKELGCALIGQSREVAPADRILYALRDVTATVESIPLITASILSKKVAAGIEGLVLDVKCGAGAFMKTAADAFTLARSLVAIGNQNRLKTEALVTAMDVPLGRAVGNALEVKECLQALHGEGPRDLIDLSLTLAARMVILGGLVELSGQAEARVREALVSGRGLEKMRRIIERQGGDPRVVDDPDLLPRAGEQILLRAARAGHVTSIHAEKVGRACMLLGAGRLRVEDAIDPAVGVVIATHRGEQVKEGDALAEVHVNDKTRLAAALELLEDSWVIGSEQGTEQPLVLERFA